MRISYSWLADYVDLTGLDAPEAAEVLTMTGTKVESVQLPVDLSQIIVGRVLSQEPHPKSRSPLWIHQVDVGASGPLTIIAGAPNALPGTVVPVARPGTTTPSGKFVKPNLSIAGVTGEGMLCSQAELGLGEDHSGILILDDGHPGQSLAELFPPDAILEAEITSNRPDCLGHLGIARELAAATGRELRWDFMPLFTGGVEPPGKELVRVTIEAPELCRRYIGAVVTGVAVGPSPTWLQRRLRAAGLRPISNVVDVTNYVLLEYGQPLHAFDLHQLGGPEIRVRRAAVGERLLCLDGEDRDLSPDNLVIADSRRPVAVAGVIGGQESAVTESTRDILLEAANFEGISIRATSRALALRTDASARFEKGLAPELALAGARRAIQLLRQVAGGDVHLDWAEDYPRPQEPIRVRVWPSLIGRRLGVAVAENESKAILGRLGFNVTSAEDGAWDVLAPVFRLDVAIAEDVVEEVGRIYGCELIPATLPGRRRTTVAAPRIDRPLQQAQEILLGQGFTEVITPALMAYHKLEALGVGARAMRLANPLSDEMDGLRTCLLPSLIEVALLNRRQAQREVSVFEIARAYLAGASTPQPEEPGRLAALSTEVEGPGSILRLKGIVDRIAGDLGLPPATYGQDLESMRQLPGGMGGLFHPGRAAAVTLAGGLAGCLGELHPAALRALGLEGRATGLELDTALLERGRPEHLVQPLPRFPAVARDLAVVVGRKLPAQTLLDTIREAGQELLEGVAAFDEYHGAQVARDEKSVAFALTFRSADRTLTDTEVDAAMQRITSALERHGARMRQ